MEYFTILSLLSLCTSSCTGKASSSNKSRRESGETIARIISGRKATYKSNCIRQ
jgi:hypothetical protein